jgi:uncharacterized protein (DUF433 family)
MITESPTRKTTKKNNTTKARKTATNDLILFDDDGTAILKEYPMHVTDVVEAQMRTGWTPEVLQERFKVISLAQVYAALAYYHAHKEELDTWIEQKWEERRRHYSQIQPLNPAPPGSNWLEQIRGQWPGDETDEEIEKALEELS